MVRITLYDPKISAEVYSQQRKAEQGFDSGVATGLARLGRALTERERGNRAANSEAVALRAAMGFWEEEVRRLDKLGAKIPPGKPGFHDMAMKEHLAERDRRIAALKEAHPDAVEVFDRHTQPLTGVLEHRAGVMESVAIGEGLAGALEGAMTEAVRAAKTDPLQHDAILERFDDALAAIEANGIVPEGVAGTRQAARRNVGMAAVDGLIADGEFEAARELLAEDRLPGLAEEDRTQLGRRLDRAEAKAAAEGEAETAAGIDAYWAGFEGLQETLRTGGEAPDVDYADETIRRVLPADQAEKMIALRTEAEDAGDGYGRIVLASPDAIDALIADAPPDEARHLRAAARERERRLAEDPAAYVLGNARVRAMHDAMLAAVESGDAAAIATSSRAFVRASAAEQRRLGVREADRRVLPAEMAADMVAEFMASEQPDPSGLGAGLRERFGDQWRPVLEDLKRHGLPEGMAAIAAMDRPEQQAAARRLSSLIGTPTSELTSGLDDETVRQIETRLNVAGPGSENARRLALSLASEGEDSKTASDYATKQTTKRPDVDDVDGSRDSIWHRRPYSADQQREIQTLFADILSATKDELPTIESRIFAVFADSPSFAERVAVQARSVIHNTGQNTIQPENARRQISEWADVIAAGGEPDEGRAAHWRSFVQLERETPYRLTPAEGGHVAFTRVGETVPFLTLPHGIAGHLAGDHENFAEVLEFLAEWRNGNLTGEDLKTEAERLFVSDRVTGFTDEKTGDHFQAGFWVGPFPTGSLQNRPGQDSVDALIAADQILSEGADEIAVMAALIPALAPELFEGDQVVAIAGLVLDMLPVIGNFRSAMEAINDFDALQTALRRGDWAAASEAGLFTALGVAGTLPGLGNLLGPLIRRARTAARSTPGLRAVEGRLTLLQGRLNFRRQFDGTSIEEQYGEAWHRLTPEQQRSLKGVNLSIVGNSGENFVADILEGVGATVVPTEQGVRLHLPHQNTLDKLTDPATGRLVGRRADITLNEEDLDGLMQWLFGFGRRGQNHAYFEVKIGSSTYDGPQALYDDLLTKQDVPDAMRLLRYPLEDVPVDYLEAETRRLLAPWVRGERSVRFSQSDVEDLVHALQTRHHSTGQPATIFDWMKTLALIEASERSLGTVVGEE